MSLEKRVLKIVAGNLEQKLDVSLGSRLMEDLKVDSFSKIMIIAALEDEFSISIDEDDFHDIETILDIVEHLRRKYPEIEGAENEA